MLGKQIIKKNTLPAIMVFVLIMACFLIYQYGGSADDSNLPLVPTENNEVRQTGSEMLQLLSELKSLSLDESIFEDKAFQSLKDFSLNLREQPIGRNNPFAPINTSEEYISDEIISDDGSTTTDISL